MEESRFSVAMCTYNGAKFVQEQLRRIVAQSAPVQEIIICDDCSADETCAIVDAFSREHPGIIRLYRNSTRLGYSQNFAQAISLCRGDIIFLSDQDDVAPAERDGLGEILGIDRKSTRLNSSHQIISYAAFCLKKQKVIPRLARR